MTCAFSSCCRSCHAVAAPDRVASLPAPPQLQPPQRVVPHPLERVGDVAEPIAIRAVPAFASFRADLHGARLDERAQLERDRAERYVRHGVGDRARLHFAVPDQAKDLAATR
jgi:hypothetical protein